MGKAYCKKCKKVLDQVLSSFECLATWDRPEEYYVPEDSCNLVKRCPACGNVTKDQVKKIKRPPTSQENLRVTIKPKRKQPRFRAHAMNR